MIELDEERSAVCSLATSNDAGLSLEDHGRLVYTAEAPRLCSVQRSSVEMRKKSLSAMTTGCQSEKVARAGLFVEGVKAGAKNAAKAETSTDSE